ncbi:MAG: hypothetical protein KJ833_06765, partial [Alphaproteobacteria bacterium]|nr:hypothetical protein [Alphaproteobacteria bacterium]
QTPKASWALFEGLFIIAALVAVFATFIAISGATPNDPTASGNLYLSTLDPAQLGPRASLQIGHS